MNFHIPTPHIPTDEEMAERALTFQKTPHGQALRETVDLISWLDRAKAANIPYVRGITSTTFITPKEVGDLVDNLASEDALHRLSALVEETTSHRDFILTQTSHKKTMWRWNICGPLELKAHMAEPGEVPAPTSLPNESLDDPRFFDIAFEVSQAGLNQIHTIVRPWVEASMVENYPVEFRVFVDAQGKTATTSYYPQRPLDAGWIPAAEKATEMAKALRPYVKEGIPYSADFLVQPDGTVLFLEGGPHFQYGGHPCCLNPQTFAENGQIVLAPEAGAITH